MKLDLITDCKYPAYLVVLGYVRVHIGDEVFLIQRVKLLEKFDLLYSLVSYLDVYRS